jgi:hypothetical protein
MPATDLLEILVQHLLQQHGNIPVLVVIQPQLTVLVVTPAIYQSLILIYCCV